MKPVTDEIIQKMVRRIARRFKPERIILFGSRARGEAGAESDVDLMVVMPVKGSKRAKRLEIGLALFDYRIPVDVVVVTPQEFETDARVPGTLVRPAVREGKLLYVHG